jgi:tetratricopeptide (TPR) repeat protein
MRWVLALTAAVLVIGAGYLLFLNPDPVAVRLTPERTFTPPLAGALLAAFVAGALVAGAVAGVRAGARGWQRWRGNRLAQREARRAALTARAEQLVWAGDYTQARTELLRAERGAPGDAARLVLLAETHLHEGDPAAARKILDDGLMQLGFEPRLLALLAEAAERAGDLRGAADALERARIGQPDSPRLARRLRDVYAAGGRWHEALALQGEILLRMRDPQALAREEQVSRGLRYEAALADGDHRRAARLLLGLAREDPHFVPAWVSAGDRFAAAGSRLTARRIWERGARRQPALVLLERIERLNASEHKPERTTRLYRRLLRRHPTSPALRLLFARHLLAQGALDQADEVLTSLPSSVAGHPVAHALWGELHRRRGNHSLAADTYARAFEPELGLVGQFRCAVCRTAVDAWSGYCAECRHWGTLRARAERVEAA